MKVTSPLTREPGVTLLEAIPAAEIVRRWEREFGFDVTGELKGREAVLLYRCDRTGLRFFVPSEVAGSPGLYARLESLDWYYLPEKWEHDEALRDLNGCRRLLEVGCGRGAFLKRWLAREGVEAAGLELNPRALEEARRRGLPVDDTPLETFARRHPLSFDGACAFQVLEHVPDPGTFLSAVLGLLRPGGLLIVSVPNAASFIRHAKEGVLDGPPHHMSRWTGEVFRALEEILPLRLRRVRREPLAECHVAWYAGIQASRVPPIGLWRDRTVRTTRSIVASAMRRSPFLRRRITGHTLYVVYEKRA